MTREEFISRVKTLKTDDEKLVFEEEYLSLSYENKERIGAVAIPFIEMCGFIKIEKNRKNREINMKNNWYKENPTDKVWWLDNDDKIGEFIFSFDRMQEFNLFADYPYKLTREQKEIFDKENPQWVSFFIDRQ